MHALEQRTIGEIAAEIPAAIGIFEQYQIDYCCGGRTPLPEACERAGISVDAFVTALGAAAQKPEKGLDWSTRTLTELQDYLVSRFHASAREELVTLTALAAKVHSVHGARRPELARVQQLVDLLQQDMLPHMMKEEMVLFPYVQQVENADGPINSCFGNVENPIRVMLMEHEAVGDLLRELRTTTGDYTLPEDACFSYRELYRRLAGFEAETHEHIHLENNVHFPRALELERGVLV